MKTFDEPPVILDGPVTKSNDILADGFLELKALFRHLSHSPAQWLISISVTVHYSS